MNLAARAVTLMSYSVSAFCFCRTSDPVTWSSCFSIWSASAAAKFETTKHTATTVIAARIIIVAIKCLSLRTLKGVVWTFWNRRLLYTNRIGRIGLNASFIIFPWTTMMLLPHAIAFACRMIVCRSYPANAIAFRRRFSISENRLNWFPRSRLMAHFRLVSRIIYTGIKLIWVIAPPPALHRRVTLACS